MTHVYTFETTSRIKIINMFIAPNSFLLSHSNLFLLLFPTFPYPRPPVNYFLSLLISSHLLDLCIWKSIMCIFFFLTWLGFFYLAYMFGDPYCIPIAHSFLLLSIPFHSLSIHPLTDILIISHLLLLQIKLLVTFTHKSLHGYMLWFLFSKYLGVELLDHMVGVF